MTMDVSRFENFMGLVTWLQIVFCTLAAGGIAHSISHSRFHLPVFLRVALCAIGAGLVLTIGGLVTMNIQSIKVGHLIENAGLCGLVLQLATVAAIKHTKRKRNA